MKHWFDHRKSANRDLEVGDLVLKWDKEHEDKGKHTKFQCLWLGPFIITEKLGPSTFRLQTLEYDIDNLPVNGHLIKRYFFWSPSRDHPVYTCVVCFLDAFYFVVLLIYLCVMNLVNSSNLELMAHFKVLSFICKLCTKDIIILENVILFWFLEQRKVSSLF